MSEQNAFLLAGNAYINAFDPDTQQWGGFDRKLELARTMGATHTVNSSEVDAVDAFCEGIAFSVDETRRVFEVAQALGLPVKLHAEQLSNLGGSAMAASFGALSVDHIEYLDQAGVDAIAASGTVAGFVFGLELNAVLGAQAFAFVQQVALVVVQVAIEGRHAAA